ncbi:SET domain-containing protein [Mycena chlorophos]|uniref:SET domain-containing protein n=1 Tax=Mycena chlorophos TaxID=658473 RepID=A0A8H6WFF0_MYCCL|nr:SET domain-containing protein [Mycena chlorophos]
MPSKLKVVPNARLGAGCRLVGTRRNGHRSTSRRGATTLLVSDHESTMRRGFLNGKKESKDDGREVNDLSTTPAAASKTKSRPTGPDIAGNIYCTIPEDAAPGEQVTECYIDPTRRAALNKIPGFPQPMQPPGEVLFRLGESPGKGMGLFATRKIKQSELISDHRPLLLSPMSLRLPMHVQMAMVLGGRDVLSESIENLVQRMTPSNRARYMALANSHPEAGAELGIFQTNCEGTRALNEVGDVVIKKHGQCRFSTVCDVISRMNHSCSPNTSTYFIKQSFSWRVWATRDIEEGEELTSSYTIMLASASTRQRMLADYAFQCQCPACTDASASNARRAKIIEVDFNPELGLKWINDASLSDDWLVEKCHAQIALIEQEGLETSEEYWEVFVTLMRVYLCLGDIKTARKWAARAYECQWVHLHREAVDGQDVALVLDEASMEYERHIVWCSRVKEEQ